jgi:Protein of unknown function (DUF805)
LSTLVVKEQPLYVRLSTKLIAYGTLGARPTPKLKEWQNSRAQTGKPCWNYARRQAFRAMTAAFSRMHYSHSDKSGWWVLIVLIPIIGAIWLLIELGLLKGTPGPNRFGPPVASPLFC